MVADQSSRMQPQMSAFDETKSKVMTAVQGLKKRTDEAKDKAIVLVRDPQFQTCTLVTAGSAVTLGGVGGAFGGASGVVMGGTAGVVPALFTFGLSIPAGAAIGGTIGLCGGTLVGAPLGGIGGFTTYKYRVEIKDGLMIVKVTVEDKAKVSKQKAIMLLKTTKGHLDTHVCKIQASVTDLATTTKTRTVEIVEFAKAEVVKAGGIAKLKVKKGVELATTTRPGVTASAALVGTAVGGTTGGGFGLVAGAALGVVPAIFTFGLSIPAGAMIGCAIGTTVGGTTGAVGGGVLGYGGFTHREKITNVARSSCKKVQTKGEELKTNATKAARSSWKKVQTKGEEFKTTATKMIASTGGADNDQIY